MMFTKRIWVWMLALIVSAVGAGAALAGGGLFITDYNITCSSATVTYTASVSGGADMATITVENLTTNQVLASAEDSPFGATVTLTFAPQPVGSVLMITVATYTTVSTTPEGCTGGLTTPSGDPAPPPRCPDGRLNYYDCEPLAIYPVQDEGRYGVEVWIVKAEDKGAGRFGFFVSAADLDALPENPDVPLLVAESEDGYARLYKLPSSELQFIVGPDFEGKTFVYRFADFPDGYPVVSTYTLTEAE
jgi:hypothetical protein